RGLRTCGSPVCAQLNARPPEFEALRHRRWTACQSRYPRLQALPIRRGTICLWAAYLVDSSNLPPCLRDRHGSGAAVNTLYRRPDGINRRAPVGGTAGELSCTPRPPCCTIGCGSGDELGGAAYSTFAASVRAALIQLRSIRRSRMASAVNRPCQ